MKAVAVPLLRTPISSQRASPVRRWRRRRVSAESAVTFISNPPAKPKEVSFSAAAFASSR